MYTVAVKVQGLAVGLSVPPKPPIPNQHLKRIPPWYPLTVIIILIILTALAKEKQY